VKAAIESLLAAVARRCRTPLLVATDAPDEWACGAAIVVSLDALATAQVGGSVVFAADLARRTSHDRSQLVDMAWERVPPGAALVVVAPNPDARPAGEREGLLDRHELRKLLEPYGRVRRWKGQPYRFLVASALKLGEGRSDVSVDVAERYRVTAALCRGRVLELGCGRGDLAGLLLASGHEVVGVDLARRKVWLARRRHPGGRFLHGDILTVDLEPESFDTGLLPEVLEHVDEAGGDRMLERAWGFVAPGGRLVVTVPNEDCIPHANHLREFDRESLEALLARFGEPTFSLDQPYKWLLAHVERPSGAVSEDGDGS
jgi:SAM-dependent methyltransferase